MQSNLTYHEEILQALRQQDAAAAERLMREHIVTIEAYLQRLKPTVAHRFFHEAPRDTDR